jgi:hypothetical protein
MKRDINESFGLGIDLGYKFSKSIKRIRENSEKFDSSGLITTLNFICKF